uniref:Uncharacterized protein n=1 Tax=Acrobeloides nanus TaxID=290746 RepID=A0A914DK51_9BILA
MSIFQANSITNRITCPPTSRKSARRDLHSKFKLNKALKEKEQNQVELRQLHAEGRECLKKESMQLLAEKIDYYYWQIPEFYTWHGNASEWKPQKRILKIGRMYYASGSFFAETTSQIDRFRGCFCKK